MTDEVVTIVFLVHGTYARGAEWVQDNSLLCKTMQNTLREAGSRAIFRPFQWSGRNSSADRLTAAKDLGVEFRRACIEFPDARFLLVGHSHGGSVIAYFWRDLESHLKKRVSGAAFLSTPFIATRMRPDWRELIAALAIATAIVAFSAIMALSSFLDAKFFRLTWDYGGHPAVTALFIVIWVAGIVVAELVRRAVMRWSDTVTSKLKTSIEVRETTRLLGGNSLFLRTTGDEAAVTLAVGQFAMWFIGVLNLTASRVVVRVWNALWRSYSWPVGAIVSALYALWVGGVVADLYTYGSLKAHDLIIARHAIATGIQQIDVLAESGVLYLSSFLALLFVGALGFMLLLMSGLLLCLLALWAAGWTGIKDGLFTEIAIEPVPLGATPLHHLDWNTSQHGRSMRHSYTYSNQDALNCISEWIRMTLERP